MNSSSTKGWSPWTAGHVWAAQRCTAASRMLGHSAANPEGLSSWWSNQPICIKYLSNWKSSPNSGKKKKMKPPPSYLVMKMAVFFRIFASRMMIPHFFFGGGGLKGTRNYPILKTSQNNNSSQFFLQPALTLFVWMKDTSNANKRNKKVHEGLIDVTKRYKKVRQLHPVKLPSMGTTEFKHCKSTVRSRQPCIRWIASLIIDSVLLRCSSKGIAAACDTRLRIRRTAGWPCSFE